MTDANEIARRLTKAQRGALVRFADELCREQYADGRTLQALDRRGLTSRYASERDFRDIRVTITPLGLAVRRALEQGEVG